MKTGTRGRPNAIGVFVNGDALNSLDMRGEPVTDDSFYIAFNAHHEPVTFTLPRDLNRQFSVVFDTNEPLIARSKPKRAIHALLPDLEGSSSTIAVAEEDDGPMVSGGDSVHAGGSFADAAAFRSAPQDADRRVSDRRPPSTTLS